MAKLLQVKLFPGCYYVWMNYLFSFLSIQILNGLSAQHHLVWFVLSLKSHAKYGCLHVGTFCFRNAVSCFENKITNINLAPHKYVRLEIT